MFYVHMETEEEFFPLHVQQDKRHLFFAVVENLFLKNPQHVQSCKAFVTSFG